ncbi:hypothetical protein [Kitasatospora purpeofusca]|uniref:hypothetical protein n=1 Tax=Kitasatospora purpeofusca TaxID=67352 RepID=UPI000A937C53|nr:hypothetical protein [Kitasatospora purpeofusca]MCX4689304.1 hypothetical protein [Kitasatospora purpeofusca]MCX4756461.1 hypothetical protein [Kitasatospora purpeofusca]MDY0816413.1 hypothetical protein [Kitasatospora purpeofusca]WSR35727.1 hypothetical protein OG715_35070 [Kitasatospora purpeofusca]WSR44034.1 hypothetical protein OG196_36050 [Kitasatospora purpeofusca]
MADAERDHHHPHGATRMTRFWHGGALVTHQVPLALVGLACLALGIVVAVVVPDSDGPAWAMAVAGCLAAGVLLLGRIGVAVFRRHRRAAA